MILDIIEDSFRYENHFNLNKQVASNLMEQKQALNGEIFKFATGW